MYRKLNCTVLALAAALLGAASSPAQQPPAPATAGVNSAVVPGGGQHQHLDSRFAHNHYYYDRGYAVHSPPAGGLTLPLPDGQRYIFHEGNWYRWRDRWRNMEELRHMDQWRHLDQWWHGEWVISDAPAGIFVPALPPYHTTVWWTGTAYYYANATYYVWDSSRNAYQVVAPPPGLDAAGQTPAPVIPGATDQFFAYPARGQTPQQQSDDRRECHQWASQESSYDPTAADAATQPREKRDAYFRAQAACLEGRGYTVR